MNYQIKRAIKARDSGNNKLFWTIARCSISKSVSFRTAAYNAVHNGWWHKDSIQKVRLDHKRIDRIVRMESVNLNYRRVYIPKDEETKRLLSEGKLKEGEGSFRPLGVPRDDWRVVMHMHAKWLTLFLKPTIQQFNHAYLPSLGTLTASSDLINDILHNDKITDVYEFDLVQFFPNVDHDQLSRKLTSLGLPSDYVHWLSEINKQQPLLPSQLHLDESEVTRRSQIMKDLNDPTADKDSPIYDNIRDLWDFEEMAHL